MVQHILIHGEPWHKAAILSAITGVPNAEASKARAAAAAAAGTTAGATATAAAAGSANAVSASGASNGNGNGNVSASTSPNSGSNGNGFGSVSGSHPSGPPKVLHMAKHKFASNVVEKCWLHAGSRERMDLIDQILGRENERQTDSLNSPFLSLVKDQYGVSHLHLIQAACPSDIAARAAECAADCGKRLTRSFTIVDWLLLRL